MNKSLLLIALILSVPNCYAGGGENQSKQKTTKRVTFAQKEAEVRVFNPNEPVVKNEKPSMKARIGNGILGIAMIWAGVYAIPTAIWFPGNNSFYRAASIGAFASGVIITLAGFKKIEHAICGK